MNLQQYIKKISVSLISLMVMRKFLLDQILEVCFTIVDISYWKINNNDIIDKSAMFYNCESLSSISDISYLNT